NGAEVDAHRLFDPGNDVDDPGTTRPGQASQAEDHRALVLTQDLKPAHQEEDHDEHRGQRTWHGHLLSAARARARRTRSRSPSTAVTSIGSDRKSTRLNSSHVAIS